MKVLYIESRLNASNFIISKEEIKKLPKNIFLAYTIQYKDLAISIKKQLEENNIKISGFSQVLGCSKINTKDSLLLIGTGRFHAVNLFLQTPEIWIIEDNKLIKIPNSEIEHLKNKKRSALMNFLKSDNIGILVTTKLGQENIKNAINLKNKLNKKNKNSFIFLSNNIDISQFENFNIDSWVNTACPGLSMDNSYILNSSEIPKI